jgi:hypothetical protein
MTLRKGRILDIERRSTRWDSVVSSLWKRLRTCRKTDDAMKKWKYTWVNSLQKVRKETALIRVAITSEISKCSLYVSTPPLTVRWLKVFFPKLSQPLKPLAFSTVITKFALKLRITDLGQASCWFDLDYGRLWHVLGGKYGRNWMLTTDVFTMCYFSAGNES